MIFSNLKGNVAIFRKKEKLYRNLSENLGKNLDNFGQIYICRGFRDGFPEAREIITKICRKINGNLKNFESFHEL